MSFQRCPASTDSCVNDSGKHIPFIRQAKRKADLPNAKLEFLPLGFGRAERPSSPPIAIFFPRRRQLKTMTIFVRVAAVKTGNCTEIMIFLRGSRSLRSSCGQLRNRHAGRKQQEKERGSSALPHLSGRTECSALDLSCSRLSQGGIHFSLIREGKGG